MNEKTAKAHGFLADRQKRIAEKCEALGMDEHAEDARNRQRRMIDPLHEAAITEDEARDI